MGEPPARMTIKKRPQKEVFSLTISKRRGRQVRPILYQRSALLEFVWFNNGLALPAALFDATLGHLDAVSYSWHEDIHTIQVHQHRKMIGLVWPCNFVPRETAHSAHRWLCQDADWQAWPPNPFHDIAKNSGGT